MCIRDRNKKLSAKQWTAAQDEIDAIHRINRMEYIAGHGRTEITETTGGYRAEHKGLLERAPKTFKTEVDAEKAAKEYHTDSKKLLMEGSTYVDNLLKQIGKTGAEFHKYVGTQLGEIADKIMAAKPRDKKARRWWARKQAVARRVHGVKRPSKKQVDDLTKEVVKNNIPFEAILEHIVEPEKVREWSRLGPAAVPREMVAGAREGVSRPFTEKDVQEARYRQTEAREEYEDLIGEQETFLTRRKGGLEKQRELIEGKVIPKVTKKAVKETFVPESLIAFAQKIKLKPRQVQYVKKHKDCLLYTSDAADE